MAANFPLTNSSQGVLLEPGPWAFPGAWGLFPGTRITLGTRRERVDLPSPPTYSDASMTTKKAKAMMPTPKPKTTLPTTSPPSPSVGDPFMAYIKEIGRYSVLSQEEEQALARALEETGDIEVAKKLVVHNLKLVVKIAMEYKNSWQNLMDLIQEGNIGLMKAVSKYDVSKGARLATYASWWIKSYILKFILDNFHLVKIGTTNEQKKLFYNLMREKERLSVQGIRPDNKQIAHNLGVSEKSVALMDKALDQGQGGEVSLDTPIGAPGVNRTTLANFLPELAQDSFEEKAINDQGIEILKEHLESFLQGLNPRDQEIFEKRLLREVPPSLQQVADEYGVSRERIRQIEERLVKNLKVYMAEFIR